MHDVICRNAAYWCDHPLEHSGQTVELEFPDEDQRQELLLE